ncbi:hypothetical protein [Vallitalea okinawensis]|uniref:hypothetical protein n=1 Tax=Vallitalea okinawensis TaxID=2078660 RepID=UPI000CFDCF4F|nr:hypothetical protein [Vallitalea okinawensis]
MKCDIKIKYDDSPASNTTNVILIQVTVDNRIFEDILDIHEFFKSLLIEGVYEYFTCSCGVFGCGGFYTKIEHTDDSYVLKNLYTPEEEFSEEDILESFVSQINWENIISVAEVIIDSLTEYFKNNIGVDLSVGVVGKLINNDTVMRFKDSYDEVKALRSNKKHL